jgi:DsbC/DsbD-like thiol-disulfide interchange protein
VFLLDEHGDVIQKRFHQSYRERETGVGILEQGFGIASTRHGPEAHGESEGVKVRVSLEADSYRFFQRLWVTVELNIDAGLHIYGRPIPEGYLPLTIDVAPITGMVVGEANWPQSHPYRVAGLDEDLSIYAGKVAVSLPVTLTEEGDNQLLHVTIRYQACSDTDCFLPSAVKLSLPLKAADHVDRPRRR